MAGHSHYNHEQHHAQRRNDEGKDAKHLRSDGSVPITGKEGARIHGKHSGEGHPTHGGHIPATSRKANTAMRTDSGNARPKPGMPGRKQENA